MVKIGQPPYLECSMAGDSRFSAFGAIVFGKPIEHHYQGAKIFADGSTGLHWREAKGKVAINHSEVSILYEDLWREYLTENPHLYEVLVKASGLSDKFGQNGHNCQAITLWKLRNEYLAGIEY